MGINELTDKIVRKIIELYPNTDVNALKEKISDLQIIESEIGEKSPFVFDQSNGIIKLNSKELAEGNYDLEYYMTVSLLLMTKPYDINLQGLRTGYFSGVASGLVGNFTKETETELETGIDLYEPLRDGLCTLNSKVGPSKTCELCESNSLEEFLALASQLGLEKPMDFLEPYKYLSINSANLTETQIDGLVDSMKKDASLMKSPELDNVKTI